ncbi:hypothetical protein [Candidatus Arthromitus sp. SFB-rat-Yit]|uniref:hypothetical protein n=1 Tax=Candidatus Arthromitus sp. SFB-rat-Yit TaxID=1041504 RepID=UPI000227A28F|nr:hypothetical protein [Candidatus Arthromitus sp. SFB-rat-Yit]BAK81431.1 putative macrolide export ATP-binding/permease protein MacB [Candidatus Arthromitus sp. SFB-rat-Yit]
MKYCSERYFFLFGDGYNVIKLLNDLEDSFDQATILNEIRNVFYKIFNNFNKNIFGIIEGYVSRLNLNVHYTSQPINIKHIKNICDGIFSNKDIKNILFKIDSILVGMKFKNNFDIKLYIKLVDLLEEIDLSCIMEIYLYLLNEDLDSVLSFILNKMNDSVTYKNDVPIQTINEKFLLSVENKLKLFKKLYDDEDICLVMKNSDHLVYRINNDIKIIQLVK